MQSVQAITTKNDEITREAEAYADAAKKQFHLDPLPKPARTVGAAVSDELTKVLLIDDCPLDRKLICQLIAKSGHSFAISEADSVSASLTMVEENAYDLLLLDYQLPDGIGPGYIAKLRDRANNFHLPIIVLTGHGDERTAIESFKDGASDYMPKDDMSTASLFRALNNALHKAKLQHRINEQRRSMIEANEILKAKNREINSFYQTVSHELKTPLTGAREFASLVMDGVVGEVNEEQRELLACSIECCDSLKILVDDLLDAAEFENDSMRISLQHWTMKDIVEGALACVSLAAQNKSADIRFTCEDNLPLVNVDKTRITQVISNIVNNAVKFSAGASVVELSLTLNRPLQQLQIDIADNGPGIDPERADKVFEKFYQVKENTESKHSGMGLGLYLCKKIIEAHQGSISVRSTAGEGSVFTFTLPFVMQ